MALLTGPEIARQVGLGGVTIDPFDPARVGANSYDLTLAPGLLVYAKNYPAHRLNESYFANRGHADDVVSPLMAMAALDTAAEEATVALTIPPEGLVLWPGVLYLGATAERAGADGFVPRIDGRSSAGRLGLSVHVTAGLGDQGFGGRDCPAAWTLEVTVVVPLRVYAGARVCQVTFETVAGEPQPYRGQYAGQTGPRPSGLWRDFAAGPVPAPAAEPPPCPGCAALRAVVLQCADRLADCSEILGRLAERKRQETDMTDDDDEITPDRLRLAGWDDCHGVYTQDGREDVFWVQRVAGTWLWLGRDGDPALLTGMADVAARLAAASRDPEGDGKNGFTADAARAKSQGGD